MGEAPRKYATFEDWLGETEAFSLRAERVPEGTDEAWLRAAFEAGRAGVAAAEKPAVIVHITDESRIPTGYLVFGDARLFIVDENVPHDRVFEMLDREDQELFEKIIPPGAEIGSKNDARHPAIEAKVNAYVDGRKHLSVVPSPEDAS